MLAFLADATSPRYNSLLPSLGHLNSSWHATVHPAALYKQTSAIVQSVKEKFCCQSPIIFAAVVRKGGSRPCLFNEHSQQSQKLPALQPAAPPLYRASTAQVFATRLSRHSPRPRGNRLQLQQVGHGRRWLLPWTLEELQLLIFSCIRRPDLGKVSLSYSRPSIPSISSLELSKHAT